MWNEHRCFAEGSFFVGPGSASRMVSYDAYEYITVDVTDGIAEVEFHRPDVHNALNTETMLDLGRAFSEFHLDRSIDVIVITGEGDAAFSAGVDIEQYAGPTEEHDPVQRDRQDLFYEIYQRVFECHAPVIAKINGYCVGGGLILALYCDLRIAREGAKFGVPTANIGQIPTGGSTYRAVELVGEAKAKELVYTAGMIDASHAASIGLINHVVAADDLDATVDEICADIQNTGRLAVKNSKRAFNEVTDAPNRSVAREREAEIWWEQFATDERRDRVDEFLE